MTERLSLRIRLTLIILVPLIAIATIAGLWQLRNAQNTAADIFNRSLLSTALAVANDVAVSGGDALSLRTHQLLANTSGGRVFYHVYAPDGVIVAGYASPPVGIPKASNSVNLPTFFTARYRGREVSGVRLQDWTKIDGFSGVFTTTIWQDTAVRKAFVRDLVIRSVVAISGLFIGVGLIVWFGVHIGLRPLLDLQDAIEKRSSDELSAIKRPVPQEVRGIVRTLNSLFAQVSHSLTAQSEFISNAAHQLRNPIAGVLSLAEAVRTAPNYAEAQNRSKDMLEAAKELAELAQKLLAFERAKAISPSSMHQRIDLQAHLRKWAPSFRSALREPIELELRLPNNLGEILGDATMLREALSNLIDNAQRHGGEHLSKIVISAVRKDGDVRLCVSDDGRGVKQEDIPKAVERFSQLSNTAGSGLGLPIVSAIAASHGGALELAPRTPGLEVVLIIPATTP